MNTDISLISASERAQKKNTIDEPNGHFQSAFKSFEFILTFITRNIQTAIEAFGANHL